MPTATVRNINSGFAALIAELNSLIVFSRELKILVDQIKNAKTPEQHALLKQQALHVRRQIKKSEDAAEKIKDLLKQNFNDLASLERELENYLSQPVH